ncbi:MAG: diacylglycerol kinase family lipid kinase [Clostridia bacterium]|nr:diacylglycerol kinase family lipid kinase [Clostridia bacterium]
MKRALFLINPNAGQRTFQANALNLAKRLLQKHLLFSCNIIYTQKGGDAFEVTSKLKPGEYDFLLAAGGDGTINEVVSGLVTSDCKIPLLILGAGTTNDFATAVGIGKDPMTLERLVKDFCVRDVDVGVLNGHPFLNVAAGGVISNIAHTIPASQKARFGILAYYFTGLKELGDDKNYRNTRIRFTINGETFEEGVFIMIVANSCQTGGFGKVAPGAKLDDGLLEVVIFKDIKKNDVLPLYSLLQSGKHIDSRYVRYLQTDAIHAELIDTDTGFMLDYDGEYAGNMPLDITVSDRKLKLIVPKNSLKTKRLFADATD